MPTVRRCAGEIYDYRVVCEDTLSYNHHKTHLIKSDIFYKLIINFLAQFLLSSHQWAHLAVTTAMKKRLQFASV